jgi:3-methyladenine DNA glycosylase AlkD
MPEGKRSVSFESDLMPETLVERLDHALQAFAEENGYGDSVETFVPGVGEAFGVRVPQLRELARELFSTYRKQPERLIEVSRACWRRGCREHRLIALFTLARMRGLSPAERWVMGEEFLPDVGDWETCDQLCAALLGPALAEEPAFMEKLETWSDNENFWVRRAALVATVSLRGSRLEPGQLLTLNRRTLKMCARLLDDPEPYIRKAVDWGLRELVKRDYGLGRDFLFDRAAHEPAYPARATLKLAARKLKEKDQQRFFDLLSDAAQG